MSHTDWLIRKAHNALADGGRIPIDLHYQLLAAGLDTEEVERKYHNQHPQEQ